MRPVLLNICNLTVFTSLCAAAPAHKSCIPCQHAIIPLFTTAYFIRFVFNWAVFVNVNHILSNILSVLSRTREQRTASSGPTVSTNRLVRLWHVNWAKRLAASICRRPLLAHARSGDRLPSHKAVLDREVRLVPRRYSSRLLISGLGVRSLDELHAWFRHPDSYLIAGLGQYHTHLGDTWETYISTNKPV